MKDAFRKSDCAVSNKMKKKDWHRNEEGHKERKYKQRGKKII
jgi:hypothetical protein